MKFEAKNDVLKVGVYETGNHCKIFPPMARSKVNDAGILLNYVVIASNVYM